MLLPAALAGVFSAGLLGTGVCTAVALARRWTAGIGERRTTASPQIPSTLTNAVPYAAPVLAAIILCHSAAIAAEPPADAAQTYSVFIPVDENQKPTGGKYLLPETFYSELYRRTALHAEKPQGWMITAAVYRAALAEDAATGEHMVDRLTVDYEIRAFNSPAHVRIPLRREEVSLVPDMSRLDDRPVQPEWDADGSADCWWTLPSPASTAWKWHSDPKPPPAPKNDEPRRPNVEGSRQTFDIRHSTLARTVSTSPFPAFPPQGWRSPCRRAVPQ